MPLITARALSVRIPIPFKIPPGSMTPAPKQVTTLEPFSCATEDALAIAKSDDLTCQGIKSGYEFLARW